MGKKNKVFNSDNNLSKAQQEIELSKEKNPLRRMDASLSRWLGVLSEKDIYEDLYPEEDWKINLYAVDDKFERLKIDLNRNGFWDEEWIIKDNEVIRTILQDNKKNSKESFLLKEGFWIKILNMPLR